MINKVVRGFKKNKILFSQAGFSLAELMVAVFLTSGVLLVAGSILLLVGKTSRFVHYSADEEANSQALKFILPLYLGQAINTDWTNSNINNIGTNRGRIALDYKSKLETSPQAPVTVAVFLHEAGDPNTTVPMSDIRAAGLYFRNPTPTTEGELIISSSPPGTGAVTVSSDNATHLFNSIVEFEMTAGGFPARSGDSVRVVQVRVVYRKFLSSDKKAWRWCPYDDRSQSNCQTGAQFVDTETFINMPLVNNALTTDFTFINAAGTRVKRKETLFGELYFFRLLQRYE